MLLFDASGAPPSHRARLLDSLGVLVVLMESVPISQGRAENKFQEVERSANLAHLLWWDVGCAWRKALQILSCLVLSVGTFTPT